MSLAAFRVAFVGASPVVQSPWLGHRVAPPTFRPRALSAISPRVPTVSLTSRRVSFRRRLLNVSRSEPLDSLLPSSAPSFTRPDLSASLARVPRHALALAARISRQVARVRRNHGSTLRLARMGGLLAVGIVSYVVTRGAMTAPNPSLATVSAPVLPSLPFNIQLPETVASFLRPFTESFGVVFLSEFGDKSMFATALMAMKHNPILVCIGAFAALTVMTFIACFLGQLMQYLPVRVTHFSSIALFVFFGIQMIMQSRTLPSTPGGAGGERADAEELVAQATVAKMQNPAAILFKVSSLIFVAEWCDRSMLATMALAASSNTVAVIGGATLANIICTGIAVTAATLVASRISERMVALIAGIMFEFFAVFTFLEGPDG